MYQYGYCCWTQIHYCNLVNGIEPRLSHAPGGKAVSTTAMSQTSLYNGSTLFLPGFYLYRMVKHYNAFQFTGKQIQFSLPLGSFILHFMQSLITCQLVLQWEIETQSVSVTKHPSAMPGDFTLWWSFLLVESNSKKQWNQHQILNTM